MGSCCSTSGVPRDVKQYQPYQQQQPYQQPYQQQYQQPYPQQYQPHQLYQQQQQQQQQFPQQFQQQFQQPYQQTSQPSNTYSTPSSPPSPPLPPLPPLSSLPQLSKSQPSDNASVSNNNRPDTIAYTTNSVYLDNNGQNFSSVTNILGQSTGDTSKEEKFPGALEQPADDIQEETKFPGTDTLPDDVHEEISADQQSIKDPVTVVGSIYTETTSDSHCLNCTSNLVDKDLDGYPSEYCSDQCRKEAAGFANPVCILCKEFPQVTGSKFCGKIRCRNLPKCYLCKVKDVHKGSLWCSKTCRDKTPNWQNLTIERSSYMCLVCGIEYALKGRDFCRDECELWVKNNSPCLLKLPPNADKYKDVHNQFVAAWKHPHKQVPSIYAIWKIYCSNLMNAKYNAYRTEVEKFQQLKDKPFPKGDGRRTMSAGNEQRRFHGTKMACRVGLQSNKVCNDKQCSVCCIIREGYKLKYVGTGTISAAFQRFGSGIYFSGTSSKSDDYNEGSLINYMGANYKMMLLNKVVVGKGFALTRDAMTLTSPPDGYDSVLGEPSAAGNLNYDEVVVYNESASIPQYLIVYRTV